MKLEITRPSKRQGQGETNPEKLKALAAVVKTKSFRLSVDLEESIYMELKSAAVQAQRPGVELVRDAIRAYLNANK